MVLDVNETLTALAALTIVVGGFSGAIGWLRHWIRKQVADPLRTSNGRSVGQYVEQTAEMLWRLEERSESNRSRLDMHEARIDAHDVRLDRHIVTGHKEGAS